MADLGFELKTINGVQMVEISKPIYIPQIEQVDLDSVKSKILSLQEELTKYQTALNLFSK